MSAVPSGEPSLLTDLWIGRWVILHRYDPAADEHFSPFEPEPQELPSLSLGREAWMHEMASRRMFYPKVPPPGCAFQVVGAHGLAIILRERAGARHWRVGMQFARLVPAPKEGG